MKKVISVLFIVLMLSGCANGGKQGKVNIAVVGKARTPYWSDVELGAKAASERLDVSIEFFAPSGEDPASWQIGKIEELIAKSVDGIAFVASDPKTLAPIILNKAMQSGIPCAAIDTDVGKSRHVYIGTGDYRAGEKAGESLVSILGDGGRVAIAASFSSNAATLKCMRGFRDILADNAEVNIVATVEKENGVVQTFDVESLLRSYPDLNGIFCVSNSDGIAVAEAVQKVNRTGKIKIVSIGESPELMKYVQGNILQVAVARDPYRIGFLSVLILHNMAKAGITNALGILPESGIIDTGTFLVTPENISQYREQLRELGIKVEF